VPPPEGLEQRISAAVWREVDAARHAPQRETRRRPFRLFSPAMAGLLTSACAVALAVLWHQRPRDPGVSDADIRYLVDAVQALPGRLASAELPAATTIPLSGPLAREVQSIRADARSALDFLAANFVPSPMLERPSSTTEPGSTQET
jgi:hypothetical protein